MLLSAFLLVLASYAFRENLLASGSLIPLNIKNAIFRRASGTAGAAEPGLDVDIVDTGYAKYQGNRTYPNTVAYLGIPYAEPPLGEGRFRAPVQLNTARVALESKGNVVDARSYPEFCIQGTTGGGDAGGAGSEDCLKVNIYAPVGANRDSYLPVLVYIHGGGYVYGNPANWPFDHWVNQFPNVVIVSVYYRLSSFGFLAHPSFKADPSLADLNSGFLDQVQALKWVKEHISSFGGDPNEVTINGESAGGSSVELHLVANEGTEESLFRGAIAQSVYRAPLPLPDQQEPLFDFYSSQAGCAAGSIHERLACLRSAGVSALARAQDAASTSAFNASGYYLFHPVVDGTVITDYPTKLIQAGKFKPVPLIVGATTNETLSGGGNDIPAALRKYFPSILDEDINALLGAYPLDEFDKSTGLQFQTLTGDSNVRCARTIMGTAFGKTTKTWTYRYNQRTPGAGAVYHAAENWMMFKGTSTGVNGTTTFNSMTPTQTAFAEELIAYWLSFVRSGDPNKFKLKQSPVWNEYVPDSARIVLQQDPDSSTTTSGSFVETENDEETRRCMIVARQANEQQN